MKFTAKTFTKTALVAVMATSMFAGSASAASSPTFKDVPKSNVHYENIYNLVDREVITGYPDNTYRPGNSLTRAEAAAILSRALVLDTEDYTTTEFTDVKDGVWYTEHIAALTDLGVLNGYGNGKFGPNDRLTREQMAVILTKAFNLYGPATTQLPFTDVAQSNFYFSFIQNLYYYEVTNGVTATTYGPKQFVRRDAMASFVVRAETVDTELKLDTLITLGVEEFNNTSGVPVKASFDPNTNEITVTVFNAFVPAADVRPLQMKDIVNTGLFSMIPYYDLQSAFANTSTVNLATASPSVARATVLSELDMTEESPAIELEGKRLDIKITDFWNEETTYSFIFRGF